MYINTIEEHNKYLLKNKNYEMKKIIFLTVMLSAFLVTFSQTKKPATKKTTKPAPKTATKTAVVKKTPAKTTTSSKGATSSTGATSTTGATSNTNTSSNFTNTENTSNTTSTSTTSTSSQNKKVSKTRAKANSESSCFSKGDNVIDLGVGFSGYGTPFHAGFEHLFTDDISAGVFANYASYFSTSVIWAGVKGNYHFNRILKLNNDKVDLTAGASIGYWSVGGVSAAYGNTVFFGVQIGGRYFFSEKIGAFAEFGGGNLSGGTVGVSFKF